MNVLFVFDMKRNIKFQYCATFLLGHLICTFISENQGLEKLRSLSNLRKISGPAHLNFFSVDLNFFPVCQLDFFQVYGINLAFFLEKNPGWQDLKFF